MKYRLTLLQNYNNYYNRQLKLQNTPQAYLAVSALSYEANFAKNDDVTASVVVNDRVAPLCDYLVATDINSGLIDSRWFITECKEMSGNSYVLGLHRDVIADYYKEIIESPCFIEKATLALNDPAIYNSENMSFNQILARKFLLKDITQSAWIVGYLPKNAPSTDKQITADFISAAPADITVQSFDEWEFYQYSNLGDLEGYTGAPSTYLYDIRWTESAYPNGTLKTSMNQDGDYEGTTKVSTSNSPLKCAASQSFAQVILNNFINNGTSELNNLAFLYRRSEFHSQEEEAAFNALDGKRITNGTVTYQIKVNKQTGSFGTQVTYGSNLGQYLFENIQLKTPDSSYDNTTFKVNYGFTSYTLYLTQVFDTLQTTIKAHQSRIHLEDAPYDMFCIPYHNIDCWIGNTSFEVDTIASLAIANAIALEGDVALYDLQLLPYCPISSIMATNRLSVSNYPYSIVTNQDGESKSIVFFCNRASFETTCPFKWTSKNTPVEFKVECECDKMRIVSPTNNGVFEFSPAKNRGITEMVCSCTYKPFNPFIHIRPNFGGLYGETFEKDARGCICGGEFSLPRLSSAWEQYEYNNKNYEEIFNRQIENMEVQNKYQDLSSTINAIAGTVGGVATGAMTGSLAFGNKAGSIGAAGVGGIASAAAGIADVGIGKALRAEALDYTRDLYGYQLGNIQALAYSLVSTGAQTLINTLFPYVEYYTATVVEKEALRNKLKYNGMTVMRIGKIKDFLTDEETYIKGKLIRLNIPADTHIFNVISEELNKGVFIKEYIDDSE